MNMKASPSILLDVWVSLSLVLWIVLPMSGHAKTLPDGSASLHHARRDLEATSGLDLEATSGHDREATSGLDLADTPQGRRFVIEDDVTDHDVTDSDEGGASDLALLNSPLWFTLISARKHSMKKRDTSATDGASENEDVGGGRHYVSSDDFMTSPDYFGVSFTLKRKYPQEDLASIERAVWIVAKTSPLEELRRDDYPPRLVAKVEDRMNYGRNETTAPCEDCNDFLEAAVAVLRGPSWLRFLYTVNTKYPRESQKKLVRIYLGDVISTSTIQELRLANYTDVLMCRIDSLIALRGDVTDTEATSAPVNTRRKRDLSLTDLEEQRFKFLERRLNPAKSGVVDSGFDKESVDTDLDLSL